MLPEDYVSTQITNLYHLFDDYIVHIIMTGILMNDTFVHKIEVTKELRLNMFYIICKISEG
jgi:hypothetical protein